MSFVRRAPRLLVRQGYEVDRCRCLRPREALKTASTSAECFTPRSRPFSKTAERTAHIASTPRHPGGPLQSSSTSILSQAYAIPRRRQLLIGHATRGFAWSSWGRGQRTDQAVEGAKGSTPSESSSIAAPPAPFPSEAETAVGTLPVEDAGNKLHEEALTTAADSSSWATLSSILEPVDRGLQPVVDMLCTLPSVLHLEWISHPYAVSILVLTFALRSTLTLPLTLWARARQNRMIDKVLPEWQEVKAKLPVIVQRECRSRGDDYATFEKELQSRAKAELKALFATHKCKPLPTILAPMAVSVPLFLLLSYSLRLALQSPAGLVGIGSEVLPWWRPSPDLEASFKASAEILKARGLEGEALREITQSYGPKLTEIDRTFLGPISLSFMTMANVEWTQWLRRKAAGLGSADVTNAQGAEQSAGPATIQEEEPLRSKIIGNALRLMAICFVIISSQVPSALLIYWLSSSLFTLFQTGTLALLDRGRPRIPTPTSISHKPTAFRPSGPSGRYGRVGPVPRRGGVGGAVGDD